MEDTSKEHADWCDDITIMGEQNPTIWLIAFKELNEKAADLAGSNALDSLRYVDFPNSIVIPIYLATGGIYIYHSFNGEPQQLYKLKQTAPSVTTYNVTKYSGPNRVKISQAIINYMQSLA
jgi:hypothetical protein